MSLIRKIFEKSSFHGFPYIVRRDIHWLEKVLWGAVVLVSTYVSIRICWNQWERYKEHPTVLGVERIMDTQEFPFMGITMCSNYFDEKQAEDIISETWNTRPNDTRFNYYMTFLRVLSSLKYDTLKTLKPYADDVTVQDIPFLKIILDIHSTLFATQAMRHGRHSNNSTLLKQGNNEPVGAKVIYQTIGDNPKRIRPTFHKVITEVGMCVSTSSLHEYQNPGGFQREPKSIKNEVMCSPFSVCSLRVELSAYTGITSMTIYVHNNKDIVPHDDKGVIKKLSMTQFYILLDLTTAENEVRFIPIKYRKCRFSDESNLKYFKMYRPILCRNECRLNAALKLCNCKPYFYVVGPPGPICTIQGMLCLAKTNWTETNCEHCLPLCSLRKYTELKAVDNYEQSRFQRTLLVYLNLPKIAIRRRVIFSTDQLVVAFGGAASFFLGCSFLSFAQILYYCLEFLEQKIKSLFRGLVAVRAMSFARGKTDQKDTKNFLNKKK